jgi:hypothetical protein
VESNNQWKLGPIDKSVDLPEWRMSYGNHVFQQRRFSGSNYYPKRKLRNEIWFAGQNYKAPNLEPRDIMLMKLRLDKNITILPDRDYRGRLNRNLKYSKEEIQKYLDELI